VYKRQAEHRPAPPGRCSTIERVKPINDSNERADCHRGCSLAQDTTDKLSDHLREHAGTLLTAPRPFAAYMRSKFKEKGGAGTGHFPRRGSFRKPL